MINSEIKKLVAVYNYKRNNGENLKLPAAVSWKRRLNYDKLTKAAELIDQAINEVGDSYRDDKYSEDVAITVKNENGEDVETTERRVKEEYREEYAKRLNDILSQETDVDIKKVRIEDLGDIDLTDSDMDTLIFMIEE